MENNMTKEALERLWNEPGVRAPCHVSGVLPAKTAMEKDKLRPVKETAPGALSPELAADDSGPPPMVDPVKEPDTLVTIRGRPLKGAPVPKIEWPDPSLAERKPKNKRANGAA